MQVGQLTDVKKLCTERHVCGTFPSAHSDVSRFGDTTMPDVETDNDAADDYLQSSVATDFILAPGASDQNLTEILHLSQLPIFLLFCSII